MKQEKKSRSEEKYGDIIGLPHYEPKKHARMDPGKRAAQFAPFAALTGYGDAVSEAARYTETGMDLAEDERERMDMVMGGVMQRIGQKPLVRIVYFEEDGKKEGGSYRELTDRVRKIDMNRSCLIMQDGQKILLKDIIDIEEV